VQAFLRRVGPTTAWGPLFVYDFYWTSANRQLLDDKIRRAEFYKNTLQRFQKGKMIFDIGANGGHKTVIFLRLGAKVVAVDPDEANFKIGTPIRN